MHAPLYHPVASLCRQGQKHFLGEQTSGVGRLWRVNWTTL